MTGSGTTTTKAARFPHARYTFFTFADPTNCVTGVQLQDTAGEYVAGGRVRRSSQATVVGEEATPVVQKDLPEGDYKMRIDTAATHCTWMVEQILNSMSKSCYSAASRAGTQRIVRDLQHLSRPGTGCRQRDPWQLAGPGNRRV